VVERRRQLALQHEARGDAAAAAVQWHILALIAPDDPAFRAARDRARAATKRAAAEEYRAALAALQKGETDNGMHALLRVLAAEPDHAEAARLLRNLGQARASKTQAERVARLQPAPLAAANRNARNARTVTANGSDANNGYDLDQSLELLRSGDTAVAAAELRRIVEANPSDHALRRRVTEELRLRAAAAEEQGAPERAVPLYEQALALSRDAPAAWRSQLTALKKTLAAETADKAQRAYKTDLAQAIAYWEASLRYDPGNATTEMRLREARKLHQKLQQIEAQKARRQ
jgi:tetratricopeptide (TPR) repeat protein